ncbi:hypothetical protein ENSA5_14420 [Enhygromyxa salina]|uniref:Uncharacterized protein n=1 Tax=Enhygromyxa salina TaxID=215803 RepID=A0A2S9YEM4_9BACT|nr:hypothetical protein [Enhygromyxa salina]PRQ03568.1 hypothetical protein ENSA5_14420 [Enhygromyxa salina]
MAFVRDSGVRVSQAVARAKRTLRTGPLPSVPWRELDRRSSVEHHLTLLILVAFAMLAGIQLLLLS